MKRILFTPGIAAVEALGSITRLIAIADELKKKQDDLDIIFRTAGREADYAISKGYKVELGYKPKFDFELMKKQKSNYAVDSLCDVIKVKGLYSKEYVQNTTVQCIEYKVPSLIFPGRHFERFYNAKKASEIGCALNLKVDSFNKEELLENCKKIMKDEECKKALNKYSLKIKSYGGAARAAELLLNLI